MVNRKRLGLCIVCGRRVYRDQQHLVSSDGHAHTRCVLRPGSIATTA
jgi:hypothetical protein